MKVAIIDPSGFTPPYDHCLATALTHQGCQVLLVTSRLSQGPWSQATDYERREEFYRIANRIAKGRIRTYLKGCIHPIDMATLTCRLQRWEPDIIHFQWLPLPLIDGLFLQRLRKISPLVITVHDTEPLQGAPSSRLQLIGLNAAYKLFDHYIVHTYKSKDVLARQLSMPEERVSVIPHGVFSCYRELLGGSVPSCRPNGLTGKKRILFLGVIKPYKGVDVLIDAFARIPEPMRKDAILQIVGLPKMSIEPLQARAHQLNIANQITWDLRFVEEIDVAAYFAQADVVVLPYRRIDQSGVLMTALAFGKPIVASRVGGFEETINDGMHGFLVEPGDVGSLTRALAHILNDDELRTRMGNAIQELSSRELSWESIASTTLEVYGECQRRRNGM